MGKSKIDKSTSLRLGIVTPTYNEIENIPILLSSIKLLSEKEPNIYFYVLVVDDSSPDGTALKVSELSKELKSKNFSINLVVRKKKDGLGRAYVYGFNLLLSPKLEIDYIIQMDADLSHNPKYIKNFISYANNGIDFTTASRYITGGDTPDWSRFRKLLSKGGNLYARIVLGSQITDYTGGFNMYSRELLRRINVTSLRSGGYGFLIELKYRALIFAESVAELPIVFMDRKHGNSKIPKSTMIKSFILVLSIKNKGFIKNVK